MNDQEYLFYDDERIVRTIYSPKTFNSSKKKLRPNFVAFRYIAKTGKHELSCNRIELDTIENIRVIGIHYEQEGENYYGVACIDVKRINSFEGLELAFTPDLENTPQNPFHCDIYDNNIPIPVTGVANPPEVNLRRTQFVELWNPHFDDGSLTKENVQPHP